MLDTFRGAKAIMTHRTLENVVVSYCSMQELTVRNYTDVFDPKLIGEQAIDVFRWAIENLIAVRRDYGEQRFIDVQYRDTVERPLDVYRSTMRVDGSRRQRAGRAGRARLDGIAWPRYTPTASLPRRGLRNHARSDRACLRLLRRAIPAAQMTAVGCVTGQEARRAPGTGAT